MAEMKEHGTKGKAQRPHRAEVLDYRGSCFFFNSAKNTGQSEQADSLQEIPVFHWQQIG